MNIFWCGLPGPVQRPSAPESCRIRGAHQTPLHARRVSSAVFRSARSDFGHSPPPLLPTPWAASFSTPSDLDIDRLRHVTARLPRLYASKAGLCAAAQEASQAKFSDQLDALRQGAGPSSKQCASCRDTFELYCFPSDTGSPDGRFHYCFACRADVRRQNNAPAGERDPIPAISPKHCSKCGVLRASAWFGEGPGPTGLRGQCRLCTALYDEGRRGIYKAQQESRPPIAEKWCCVCKETLPAGSFAKVVSTKDGYRGGCRACERVQRGIWMADRSERSKNRTLVLAVGKERVCSGCSTCKPWTDFGPASHNNNIGINSQCKQCRNTYVRLWRSKQKIAKVV